MTETTSTVTVALQLHLLVPDGPSLPVDALATYRADDPWAIRVAFATGPRVIEWMFARQLITDGITTPAGEGDVRIWPTTDGDDDLVLIAMASPSGSAVFEIRRAELLDFLQATYVSVPLGAESLLVDLDAELLLLVPTD